MSEAYCEILIKRRLTNKALLHRVIAIIATLAAITLGVMALGPFGIFIGALLIWIDTIIFRNTDIEYEYQFVGGELDIDVVYGRIKRKRARQFDMRKIEVLAPFDSDKLAYAKNSRNIKGVDYSSGYSDRQRYAFVIPAEEGATYMVVFEPTEEMVDAIRTVAPSKVHKY